MNHDQLCEAVARIDERTLRMDAKLDAHIADVVNYVRKEEFRPVKRGFYGIASIVLLSVTAALMKLIGIEPVK